jgi:dihydrofolate reductase
MAYSLEDAISACAGDDEIFIVGGAELYALAMPLVDIIYLTEIRQDVAGDAHFLEFDKKLWQELAREQCSQEIPQALEYHFVTYGRKE